MDNPEVNGAQNGTFRITSKTSREQPLPKGSTTRLMGDKVTLEALVNVLVQQGLCTEEQLLAEEARLRAVQRTMANLHFKPVRVSHAAPKTTQPKHPVKQWAAQRRWTRLLGSYIFGWKWRKYKKKEKT